MDPTNSSFTVTDWPSETASVNIDEIRESGIVREKQTVMFDNNEDYDQSSRETDGAQIGLKVN